jgi:hypothetical protein
MTNKHAEALRVLGRTLSKEQMFICFDAANEIASLEGRLVKEVADLTKRADSHWEQMCHQMKRADELEQKLDSL